MDQNKLAERRKVIIKSICEKMKCPALVWAFSDPITDTISSDLIGDFHHDLMRSLHSYSGTGHRLPLPNNTDPYHLPAYVALDKIPGGALALHNLGYRPSWEPPVLSGEKYEVKFFMPNATPITFLTGPSGGFSVFSLWLDMRIICGEKGERNPQIRNQSTPSRNNDFVETIFQSAFAQRSTRR